MTPAAQRGGSSWTAPAAQVGRLRCVAGGGDVGVARRPEAEVRTPRSSDRNARPVMLLLPSTYRQAYPHGTTCAQRPLPRERVV
jgi:hypothetical protein